MASSADSMMAWKWPGEIAGDAPRPRGVAASSPACSVGMPGHVRMRATAGPRMAEGPVSLAERGRPASRSSARRRPRSPALPVAAAGTARSEPGGAQPPGLLRIVESDDAGLTVGAHPPERGPILLVVVVGKDAHARVGGDVLEPPQPGGPLGLVIDRRVQSVAVERERDRHHMGAPIGAHGRQARNRGGRKQRPGRGRVHAHSREHRPVIAAIGIAGSSPWKGRPRLTGR